MSEMNTSENFRIAICDESYKLSVQPKSEEKEAVILLPDMNKTTLSLPAAKGSTVGFGVIVTGKGAFSVRLGQVWGLNTNDICDNIRITAEGDLPVRLQALELMMDDQGWLRSDVELNCDYVNGFEEKPVLLHGLVTIPEDTKPGNYAFTVKAFAQHQCQDEIPLETELTVDLKVYDVVMPAGKDRTFILDLWQHPCNIARKHDVRLWSDEHFAVLEEYIKSLADLGVNCLTIDASEIPWRGQQCFMRADGDLYEYSSILITKKKDGTFFYDFAPMRRYIDLGFKYGVDHEIEVFGLSGVWKDDAHGLGVQAEGYPDALLIRYFDEATGTYKFMHEVKEIEDYFVALMQYFRDNGLEDKVRISVDEPADVEAYAKSVALLRELWPGVKFKTAINHVEFIERFHEEIDVFTPYVACLSRDWKRLQQYMEEMPEKTYLWYVCCGPWNMNTFIKSDLLEARYLGILTSFLNLDGFLRWNYTVWPNDPRHDIRYNGKVFPAGDTNFVYPANNGSVLLSQRWYALKRGVEDFELLAKVKAAGKADVLQKAFDLVVREKDGSALLEKDTGETRKVEELQSLDPADFNALRALLLETLEA